MSSRNKLKRFAAVKEFPNVFEFTENIAGKWHAQVFKNNNPIIVELACGKGAYTLGIAAQNPNVNTIGVDLKAERLYIGAKAALGLLPEEQLPTPLPSLRSSPPLSRGGSEPARSDVNGGVLSNVAFLRCKISELDTYFTPGEISEIWITFPDPFPRAKQAKHRLTSPSFLHIYKSLLAQKNNTSGVVHLKTDDPDLFEYSLETVYAEHCDVLQAVNDIYAQPQLAHPLLAIKTPFEHKHLAKGRKIHYLQFRFAN